jgi:hypothetical protein
VLRLRSYELVFQYPASGLRYMGHLHYFYVLSRAPGPPAQFESWLQSNWRQQLRTEKLADLLSPVLISRQFYEEVLPVFLTQNTFHLDSTYHLERFLESLPFKHLQQVRTIMLDCGTSNRVRWQLQTVPTFQLLVRMQKERKLNLRNFLLHFPTSSISLKMGTRKTGLRHPPLLTTRWTESLESRSWAACGVYIK